MRAVIAVAAVLALLSAGSPAVAQTGLAITGYQQAYDPANRIDASAAALTTVGVDGVTVTTDGTSVPAPDAAAVRQRVRAQSLGLRAELLVSNFSDDIGDFSEPVAYRLLSNDANIETVTSKLAADVTASGWDGICVDLESMLPRDATGLIHFLTRLRQKLGTAGSISIAVMASTSASGYAATGYRLKAIAAQVDLVQLMTYDQHGPWENTPGPIGALNWQRKAIGVVLKSVPAAQLDLGQAGYGYAWRPHSNDQLSDAQARTLAGSRARFDTTVGEWTATLADGSTLWWADARSFALRRTMAQSLGLHGIAMWCLGSSDPIS